MSIRHPSLLPDVVLSVLLKRERAKPFGGWRQKEGHGQIHKTAFRQAEIQTHGAEGSHKRHREREAENSNLGSFLVKLHQGELLLNFFSLMRCLRIIGDSEFIINGCKLIP